MKNTFFNGMVFQGQKNIFQNWFQASPLCQLNQTYRFIMLDQKGFFSHQNLLLTSFDW